jgi:hypothetical protein
LDKDVAHHHIGQRGEHIGKSQQAEIIEKAGHSGTRSGILECFACAEAGLVKEAGLLFR